MEAIEKARLKFECLRLATNLKQATYVGKENDFSNKTVVELAKEFETFVFST